MVGGVLPELVVGVVEVEVVAMVDGSESVVVIGLSPSHFLLAFRSLV